MSPGCCPAFPDLPVSVLRHSARPAGVNGARCPPGSQVSHRHKWLVLNKDGTVHAIGHACCSVRQVGGEDNHHLNGGVMTHFSRHRVVGVVLGLIVLPLVFAGAVNAPSAAPAAAIAVPIAPVGSPDGLVGSCVTCCEWCEEHPEPCGQWCEVACPLCGTAGGCDGPDFGGTDGDPNPCFEEGPSSCEYEQTPWGMCGFICRGDGVPQGADPCGGGGSLLLDGTSPVANVFFAAAPASADVEALADEYVSPSVTLETRAEGQVYRRSCDGSVVGRVLRSNEADRVRSAAETLRL